MAFASAAASVRAVNDVKSSANNAKKKLQTVAGGAKAQVSRLSGHSSNKGTPSDGSCCESCGTSFGFLQRRNMCASCDRYLCASCMGGSFIGVSCLCAAACPPCRELGARTDEFGCCRSEMEGGVMAMLTISSKGGFFGGSASSRKLAVWLSVDVEPAQIHWATLEQRAGVPLEEGFIATKEVIVIRDTGAAIEISIKDKPIPLVIEFHDACSRTTWTRYLELAVEILTPESERAALTALRTEHRQRELDERRTRNEERKKELSKNLGMRYTAEAMAARGSASRS